MKLNNFYLIIKDNNNYYEFMEHFTNKDGKNIKRFLFSPTRPIDLTKEIDTNNYYKLIINKKFTIIEVYACKEPIANDTNNKLSNITRLFKNLPKYSGKFITIKESKSLINSINSIIRDEKTNELVNDIKNHLTNYLDPNKNVITFGDKPSLN